MVMDKMTQKSKGYGFVTFKGMDGAHAALEQPEKMIDVSPNECRSAFVGQPAPGPPSRVDLDLASLLLSL